jgi:PPOX class probable F420-dependent enzyme
MAASTTTNVQGRYLSLTTYKRDGTGVATPVWFVEQDGQLLIQTDGSSGKVKRIRANPHVTVAVCTASGRVRTRPRPCRAKIVETPADVDRIETLIRAKYRGYMPFVTAGWWLARTFHLGRRRGTMVGLAISNLE